MTSCINRASQEATPADPSQTYFSLRQFAKDQWDTYYAQPYTLYRIVTLDGRSDTTLVNFLNMDWGAILHTFLAADISDPKFVGRYRFSMFDDTYTGNRSFVYDAIDPDLFTRQLQLTVDPTNNKILSVYVETFHQERWRERHQRLLYKPLRILQIQEDSHETPGGARSLRVEYRFLQANDDTDDEGSI